MTDSRVRGLMPIANDADEGGVNGGRIIVMGDGMVSLYMTSREGVQDYQCQELMQATFRWLLK